jgi:hypothetical protein
MTSRKYCRSLHSPLSLGTTSDDRFMPSNYLEVFSDFKELVITEKLDGQNNCFKKDGVFARSHVAPTSHPWDVPMRTRWELIKNDLGNLELFGENMYGIHSIQYSRLESYFYVFAAREGDEWLSWDEVKFYSNLFDFPTVPELSINSNLKDFSDLDKWIKYNIGYTWEEFTNTSGELGGNSNESPTCEGLVIRNRSEFKTNNGILNVASNEFDSLFKLVRKDHVKTDVHWTKTWKPSKLINYEKYKWDYFKFLNYEK